VTLAPSFSLLVHAHSKTGKTTLAGTCPPPVLMLDAEGRSRFLPLSEYITAFYGRPVRLTSWVPTGPPPRYDGTWDICVVYVGDWATVVNTVQWLHVGQHDFKSVVVDSITELQRKCKTNLKGTEAMKIQDWGELLTQMDTVIRTGLRDLTLHPTNPIDVVMFIAETRQSNGKWKPYMQGQIEVALPYWMDIIGYLYIETLQDANGQTGQEVRRLLISQHPLYEAGEAVQGRLGRIIEQPNVYQMYHQLFGDQIQMKENA